MLYGAIVVLRSSDLSGISCDREEMMIVNLTEYELQMMHVFWNAEESITSVEVLRRSIDKDWKDNSLHPMLQRLVKKGFIREDGVIREGRAFARTFAPAISCEEYYSAYFACLSKDAGVPTLFSALIKDADISASTLLQLEALLEQKKEELKE